MTKKKKAVNLQAPWMTYADKVRALFGQDPDVTIEYDNDKVAISLYVDDYIKAAAIEKLLPSTVNFGNVTLTNTVYPSDNAVIGENIVKAAFEGNPIFSEVIHADKGMYNECYAVFKKQVIQFFNDDLTDINGNFNGLAQDIAKEIIPVKGVNYCTAAEDPNE